MRNFNGDVLLVVARYPHRPQTFIVNEFAALIDAGVDVWLLTLRGVNRRLMRRWPAAAATRQRVIAGSPVYRRRYRPIAVLSAFVRAVLGANLNRARHASKPGSAAQLRAAAWARIGAFRVVHFQSGGSARSCSAPAAAQLSGAAVFVSLRGKEIATLSDDQLAVRYRSVVNRADCLLPVCDAFAKRLIRVTGVSPDKVHVHYSGIDARFFAPSDAQRRARDAATQLVIYSAGRLTEKKGPLQSLDAYARLRAQLSAHGIDSRMILAGTGPLLAAVRARVAQPDLHGAVTLEGAYDLQRHRDLLWQSHIFVSLNITADDGDQEGIPNVLKEAMAAELPVVATVHSGTPELVTDGHDGFLVPEGDVQAAAERIATLARDPALRTRIGTHGRCTVAERFDIEVTSAQLQQLYQRYRTAV